MANMGKQKVSPRAVQKKGQKKSIFEQGKFPQAVQNVTDTPATTDLSEYPQPQPGEMITNVMSNLPTSKSPSPPDYLTPKQLPAPKRQPRESNIAPGNQLKAPPRLSLPTGESVQTKLTIGKPNDRYEQEADRVSARVVQQINLPAPVSNTQGGVVQGKDEGLKMKPMAATTQQEAMPEEGGLQMMPMVQRQEAIGGGETSTQLSGEINRAKGGGQSLDAGLQQSIGQAMGNDFSGVRVHTDERADRLNRSLSARAFTTGQDLFFKKGEYQPGSREGQGLIAHELAHVVQQNNGVLRNKTYGKTLVQASFSTQLLGEDKKIYFYWTNDDEKDENDHQKEGWYDRKGNFVAFRYEFAEFVGMKPVKIASGKHKRVFQGGMITTKAGKIQEPPFFGIGGQTQKGMWVDKDIHIVTDPNKVFITGTSLSAWKNGIKENGLDPKYGGRGGRYTVAAYNSRDYVYFWHKEDHVNARAYAKKVNGKGNSVRIKFTLPVGTRFERDPELMPAGEALRTQIKIEPEWFIKKDNNEHDIDIF
ncbi:MAG: DUF4157 domain-containing protein [Calothrix sp. MO_167.B42]|nr:DUF4157 domain-containing protein [Calothrix sp. MO_167.B42]